jgi:colanic acid biosynthesis glycosyl transferase WcaI
VRILIYGLNYAPELTGIGKYTGEMAEWLTARGHEVRVVTAPPYYPAWKIREDYRGTFYRVENRGGKNRVKPVVYRTPLYVPERPSGLKRVAHLASFMLGTLPVMVRQMFWEPDVVFTVEPTFFCAPLALMAAQGTGAESWLHVQDFEVDAAFDLGLLPAKGPVHSFALWLEEFFTRGFSRVSSISEKMVERSLVKGVVEDRAVLFPNWVDVEAIRPLESGAGNRFRAELGLEGKTVLLYSGNMGAKQGLEVLAPLARSFEDDTGVHFVFCGDGAFRPILEESVRGHANVTLLPLQPYERLNELLNMADVHLLPQRADAADLVMPSRLTGMLSSGRPVLATATEGTQVARVVGGGTGVDACGVVVPAADEYALHEAARQLIEDSAIRARLGANGRRYAVEYLGKQQVLERFERDLNGVIRRIR